MLTTVKHFVAHHMVLIPSIMIVVIICVAAALDDTSADNDYWNQEWNTALTAPVTAPVTVTVVPIKCAAVDAVYTPRGVGLVFRNRQMVTARITQLQTPSTVRLSGATRNVIQL